MERGERGEFKEEPEEPLDRKEVFENFQAALKKVKMVLGLELTNIEKVGLRRIVEQCLRESKKVRESSLSETEVDNEAFFRFINEFYGMDEEAVYMLKREDILQASKEESEKSRKIREEYLKRLQKKLHHED